MIRRKICLAEFPPYIPCDGIRCTSRRNKPLSPGERARAENRRSAQIGPAEFLHKEMSGVRNWPSALAFSLFGDIWERKSGVTQAEVTSSLCWEGRRHWGVRTSPWPQQRGVRAEDKASCQTQHGVRGLPHVSWKEDTAHTEKGLPREHLRMMLLSTGPGRRANSSNRREKGKDSQPKWQGWGRRWLPRCRWWHKFSLDAESPYWLQVFLSHVQPPQSTEGKDDVIKLMMRRRAIRIR